MNDDIRELIKVRVSHVTYFANTFVPRRHLEPTLGNKIWMTVNRGDFPPVEIVKVLSEGDYLAVDGQSIYLQIDPHNVFLSNQDLLIFGQYQFIIEDIFHYACLD